MTVANDYRAGAAALLRAPDDPQALTEQFVLLSENGKQENARAYLTLAKRAYHHAPAEPLVVFNYASALNRAGDFKAAARAYRRLADMDLPDWKQIALHHLALTTRCMGDWAGAVNLCDAALSIRPCLVIEQDRAIFLKGAGRLNEGLRAHEVRKPLAAARGVGTTRSKLPDDAVHWQGQDLAGKTITIYHEEGIGDLFMWCRFFDRLRYQFGPDAVFLTGRQRDVLELVADNVAIDGILPLSDFKTDYVAGSLTVPWRCGVDYSDVTGAPYFFATEAKIPRRGKLNVGLVWAGNPAYNKNHIRTMRFSEFVPLFDLPDVAFHSLQFGEPGKEVDDLGFTGFVADLMCFAKDWRATASLIQALDVIVTVDTAVAHLAGALGKPVYTLITNAPDWRWPLKGERTPWYDSMRVIRQKKQDDWAPCIERVRKELEDHVRAVG